MANADHPTDSEQNTAPSGAAPQPALLPGEAGASLPPPETALEAGKAQVQLKVSLPPGTNLRITLETYTGEDGTTQVLAYTSGSGAPSQPAVTAQAADGAALPVIQPSREVSTLPPSPSAAPQAHAQPKSLPWRLAAAAFLERAAAQPAWLLAGGLGIYLLVRLAALPAFPIYFFTDEAVQTQLAADFLRDQLQNYAKDFLPTYFQNGGQYNLSLSVYLQVLPYLLFGSSIELTRGVPALVSLLAGIAAALSLQRVFHSQFAWLGALALSITPAWFLHSRTAFETSLATTFYAVFLYAYLLYRTQSPRHLYLAVAAGWLCFYSYSPAQVVVAVSGTLLLLVDLPYHWRNRGIALRAAGLALIGALPYLRFQLTHPGESGVHLRMLGSYWVASIPLAQKIGLYLREYLLGLSPVYWFAPNQQDLPRHLMKDYGHLLRLFLPFALIGLYRLARNLKKPEYRVLLIGLLAAPSGAAVVKIGITRALFMVAPMALITALGIETTLIWLRAKLEGWAQALENNGAGVLPARTAPILRRAAQTWLILGVFLLLVLGNLWMLGDALINGPTWFRDYGLNGMQWGARQVFAEIRAILNNQPETRILLSPAWANGTDTVARFFFPEPMPFALGNLDLYVNEYRPFDDNMLFVMIPEEYARIPKEKFTDVRVEKVLPYPDGRPGFYFVRMRYVDDIEAVFAQEAQERKRLLEENVILPDNSVVRVRYSRLDMGRIIDALDGDPESVIRTFSANPLRLQIEFPAPRVLSGVTLRVGGTASRAVVRVQPSGGQGWLEYEKTLPESVARRDLPIPFGNPLAAQSVWLELYNAHDGELAHVHLWEITFVEP